MDKKLDVKKIVLIGLLTAVVFVSNYIQIPLNFGGITRLHVANGFCILAGFLLGGFFGGLSAGLGSFLFDLTNPLYVATAPITFIFKFIMGFISGKISWFGNAKGYSYKKNLIASILGAFIYVLLYLSKGYITDIYVKGLPVAGALANILKKGFVSSVNAIFAVIIANILISFLNPMINKREN